MTGIDHDPDALIAALRSPALPAEQVGETAAVTAMVEALSTAAPAPAIGLRSRRGIAVAAVTVASLGVGGLVAAGPGIFRPSTDRPPVTLPASAAAPSSSVSTTSTTVEEPTTSSTEVPAVVQVDDSLVASDIECVGDTHGDTVSAVAQETDSGPGKGDIVSEAARSDCGKNTAGDVDEGEGEGGPPAEGPAVTAPGLAGGTPTVPTPSTSAPATGGQANGRP